MTISHSSHISPERSTFTTISPSPPTSPEEPPSALVPRRLVAGYVLSGVTSLRLVLRMRGRDPDSIPPPTPAKRAAKPRSFFTYDLLHPEPHIQPVVKVIIIKRSLRKYMFDNLVDVWYTEEGRGLETIIITQGCFASGPPPVATEGQREKLVRQWLENKGNVLLTVIPSDPAQTFPSGVDEGEYTWEVRDDCRDVYD